MDSGARRRCLAIATPGTRSKSGVEAGAAHRSRAEEPPAGCDERIAPFAHLVKWKTLEKERVEDGVIVEVEAHL